MKAHPFADKYPMLPESELAELAESIAANGLRQPIVVDREGRILDGRNRAKACEMAGIAPVTETYDGEDLAEYVIDCNTTRRHMSTGARAMATALVLAEDGRRENGRWAYGALAELSESGQSDFRKRVNESGVVLDFKPDLADAVVAGDLPLDNAYQQAKEIKDSAERDKILERERRKREREEAAAEAERNAQIVADLTAADSKYLDDIESKRMTPKAAWAAHLADTEKERRQRAEIERGWRDTCTRIAEAVRTIGGGTDAATYLREFHPHASNYVPEGLRLTHHNVDSAINFLLDIKKGI